MDIQQVVAPEDARNMGGVESLGDRRHEVWTQICHVTRYRFGMQLTMWRALQKNKLRDEKLNQDKKRERVLKVASLKTSAPSALIKQQRYARADCP